MITKIQGYNFNNSKYNRPSFGAKIAEDAKIWVKRRGENLYVEYSFKKFFKRLKDMFFETFPKLDPEYKSMKK